MKEYFIYQMDHIAENGDQNIEEEIIDKAEIPEETPQNISQEVKKEILPENASNQEEIKIEATNSFKVEGTIITQDYADKVDPKDYKYYSLPNDKGYSDIIQRFTPDDDDIFLFKNTKDQLRLPYSTLSCLPKRPTFSKIHEGTRQRWFLFFKILLIF